MDDRQYEFFLSQEDERFAEDFWNKEGLKKDDWTVCLNPGGNWGPKRWPKENFASLADRLIREYQAKIIFSGSKDDILLIKEITRMMEQKEFSVSAGYTNLKAAGAIFKKANLTISGDSGPLHIAASVGATVLALFGPTSPAITGPIGSGRIALMHKPLECRVPCYDAACNDNRCMREIKVEDVLAEVKKLEEDAHRNEVYAAEKNYFSRILVVRTDRIGDVVLTTPVLKALRENYPASHIAMMVNPQTKELLEGNPYLNEVIVYDKDKKDKGMLGFWRFVLELKRKRFDLAIVLHTKNRLNLITYLADIKRRAGYKNNKFGFLLTDKLIDIRPLGLKHEVDYCLDILRKLGLKISDKIPYLAVKNEDMDSVGNILEALGVNRDTRIAAIHPGSSCISKRWPRERFVVLANRLVEDYGLKVILIASGEENEAIADEIARQIRYPVLNLSGKLSLGQVSALLKRCVIFISNDSGPVHIASAVGTPVVSIFGVTRLV